MVDYQWELMKQKSHSGYTAPIWQPKTGCTVLTRKQDGTADRVRVTALVDHPETRIYLVGPFNEWGGRDIDQFALRADDYGTYYALETDKLSHNTPYKFLVYQNAQRLILQDPAGVYFDQSGNSVFWDYGDPSTYKRTTKHIDTFNRSTKILQTDLPGLIAHWSSPDGTLGKDVSQSSYYTFIATSGVLDHVRDLGFNTIQFLPFAQSIDGDNWKYRYLVPFQFAIQNKWGTPDDFARLIDACHERGIAVIGDFVIGHFPYKDYKVFGFDGSENGIQLWMNRHGTRLFMKEETSWGTMRVDMDNAAVRAFIADSCVHFMNTYGVDGLRIDNVDGILRYGANGDGEERQHGRTFLRELTNTIYLYNPGALIHFESHYFYKDNAKLLVSPLDNDPRALGATAYTSSRLTYYFHTEFMLKSVDKITPWKFRDIFEEKSWGKSASTIADFHNHDAAAGLIPMRATGSYAYDAMTCDNPNNHPHALGKIKAMEAILSATTEGRTLNLLQSFLLQTGTFEHDSSIHWFLTYNQCNRNLVAYKQKINLLMDDSAFWPGSSVSFLNVDDGNKILVVERSSSSSTYVIVINLSSFTHHNYAVGVKKQGTYAVAMNSDLFDYSGTGIVSYPDTFSTQPSTRFELLNQEIVLPTIAPYGVVFFKLD